jgi:hypothetical protein
MIDLKYSLVIEATNVTKGVNLLLTVASSKRRSLALLFGGAHTSSDQTSNAR